jgi:uncharacterized protein YbjT (DUF2867 family)
MRVFVIGATGGVGGRVARRLLANGHVVSAITRRTEQYERLLQLGIAVTIADIAVVPVDTLADAMRGCDLVLFSAGAGGRDSREATTAVDGDGPGKAAAAADIAGVSRFYLVSVFPEAWRERRMDDEFEHYMREKKKAEAQLVATDLDWVILRPSALTDEPGTGTIDLGYSKIHREIRRDDVSDTLIALMANPRVKRSILEVTAGSTPIAKAVATLAA